MDVHDEKTRSYNMSRIRGKNTKPEMVVRRLVHKLGYRFRLHRRDLPGTPDLVFAHLKRVINVHGCFWHMHPCRYGRVTPKVNASFWKTKRVGNVRRDRRNSRKLRAAGWGILTIWECQTRDINRLAARISEFLS